MAKPLVAVVLGTRPEAIKLAPVVRALERGDAARVELLATGQHRELLRPLLRDLGLRADRDLRLMRPGQSLNSLLARAIERLGSEFARRRPALVVVQGDTTTALAAALAAYHEGIPVAHVEAGLRTGDPGNPFPEEVNRAAIDALASLRFAPTRAAAARLRDGRHAEVTGNTSVDSLRWALARRRRVESPVLRRLLESLRPGQPLALATLHRRESQGGAIEGLLRGFVDLLERQPDLHLVLPVHPNPRVTGAMRRARRHPRLHLAPPLGYGDTVAALKRCRLVLTDSGGLVEEAAALGRPVLILRRRTERPEAVRAGVAVLAGTSPKAVAALAARVLDDRRLYKRMARPTAIFGDGRAGERVARSLAAFLRR